MALLLRSVLITYDHGHIVHEHAHAWGQLVYARRGAIAVKTAEMEWLVPPARGAWLPPAVEHQLTMHGNTTLQSLYLSPTLVQNVSTHGYAFEVSALLRELIAHLAHGAPIDDKHSAHAHTVNLLLQLLDEAKALPFQLRTPSDPRAARVAALIRRAPGDDLSLRTLAKNAGATERTLQRLFLKETGLRLSEWRLSARLLHATALLQNGLRVSEVALACGYANSSTFVTAFRRWSGATPATYRASTLIDNATNSQAELPRFRVDSTV